MRMVLGFYGLAEQPFGVSPDPRFFFLSPTHREAFASVLCAVSSGRGFTALIAKPGMGKTTLLFDLLNFVKDQAKTAFLFQSQCTPRDLLGNLLEDLEIQDDFTDFARMQRKLNNCLLNESRHGRQVVVIIDEAQNLDDSLLEVVRMLSNFETAYKKLMHFVLAGQPQLAEKLASPRLLQLKQRISIVARLDPFSPQEVHGYIDHRLGVAAYSFNRPLFTKQALSLIVDASEGIPRNINNICFNALSIGYVSRQNTIDVDVIREVLNDLDFRLRFREPVPAAVTSEPIAPPVVAAAQPPVPQQVESNSDEHLRARHVGEPPAHPDTPRGPSLESTNHLFSSHPSSRRLALTFALVLELLIVLLGVFFLWTRHHTTSLLASTPAKVAATSAVDPMSGTPAPPDPLPIVSPPEPAPVQPAIASLVVVQPNQTLYRIIVDNFGQYNETTVKQIRALNPWLTNERRIRVGQIIRLRPDSGKPSKTASLAAEVSQSQNPQQMGKGTE
jgi:type II secretory pathway predicted ATPase ExeA/LysM repeat protein